VAFKIKAGRYIARMYYGELAKPQGNVMAFFYRDARIEANEWTFQYRFRYYMDDKVYQSADKRSQEYIFNLKGTFDELLPKVQQILLLMTIAADSPPPDEDVNSDDPEVVLAIMFKQDWAHPEGALSRMNTVPVGFA